MPRRLPSSHATRGTSGLWANAASPNERTTVRTATAKALYAIISLPLSDFRTGNPTIHCKARPVAPAELGLARAALPPRRAVGCVRAPEGVDDALGQVLGRVAVHELQDVAVDQRPEQ